MKRLDTVLRITAIALFIIMCLLSMAFASSEEASATDADMTEYEYEVTITPPDGWYDSTADVLIAIKDVNGMGFSSASVQRPRESSWTEMQGGSSSVKISGNGTICAYLGKISYTT